MINRYTSRKTRIDKQFLSDSLHNARSYDRIAGYFSSSILEIAGEAIASVTGKVRVVCNSQIEKDDCITATAAHAAMRRDWCSVHPETAYENAPKRLKLLYELIKNGKLEVRVLPDKIFGLIHGKAGVITLENGSKTSFIGSVNETLSAWRLNYELLWEDTSQEAVDWVQAEFDFFWEHPNAIPLSEFVIEDIGRISERKVIGNIESWRETNDGAPSAVVESPVYREELGLWEHQKSFVELAFRTHKKPYGARFVLADQVGLGKTVQLALSAQLMALWGDKPILIIVPKTLVWQWQEEMKTLLDMPSAVFESNVWVDENGIKHTNPINRCPRRIGIISQGLIVNGKDETIEKLLRLQYECVIVDESHRARRKHVSEGKENAKPNPNNLYEFLLEISKKTHSMLLATATPVQMHPIEAWDLLNILSQRDNSVLGSDLSLWRRNPKAALELIMGKTVFGSTPEDLIEQCEWLRDPFPPAEEDVITFGEIRRRLKMSDNDFVIKPDKLRTLIYAGSPESRRLGKILENNFIENHNPFICHIVRRTRDFLENNTNPQTGEPFLKRIDVELLGEKNPIILPTYLQDAYHAAEAFCEALSRRTRGSGFVETLLLKRVGSTMIAGRKTAEKMLKWGFANEDTYAEDDETEGFKYSEIKDISDDERSELKRFIEILDRNKEKDPKYELTLNLLVEQGFAEKGCIVFSQYFDSAYWIAESLSLDIKDLPIGLYAGGDKSGVITEGKFIRKTKEDIKKMVKTRELRILVGTDAASEGLNLQTLSTLINLDLPWNPTRLEQRKGRIQRIGQQNDSVVIYNMRYKDSVEDKVHSMLSKRLENIKHIFGQIPDVLEDVWVKVALGQKDDAERLIDNVPLSHPFEIKYEKQAVTTVNWESCRNVLDSYEKRRCLNDGWE